MSNCNSHSLYESFPVSATVPQSFILNEDVSPEFIVFDIHKTDDESGASFAISLNPTHPPLDIHIDTDPVADLKFEIEDVQIETETNIDSVAPFLCNVPIQNENSDPYPASSNEVITEVKSEATCDYQLESELEHAGESCELEHAGESCEPTFSTSVTLSEQPSSVATDPGVDDSVVYINIKLENDTENNGPTLQSQTEWIVYDDPCNSERDPFANLELRDEFDDLDLELNKKFNSQIDTRKSEQDFSQDFPNCDSDPENDEEDFETDLESISSGSDISLASESEILKELRKEACKTHDDNDYNNHQESDNDNDLSLSEWLKKQIRKSTPSSTKNVIILEPDPSKQQVGLITPLNPILCKLCCKKLNSEWEVKIHVKHCWLHNKSRHVTCIPCKRTFGCPANLKRHNYQFKNRAHVPSHPDPKPNQNSNQKPKIGSKHKCDICQREFNAKQRLNLHIETHKSKEERTKSFHCSTCGSSYYSRENLKYHEKSHLLDSLDKPFKCSHSNCQMAFKTNCKLRNHIATHSDSRPFTCPHPNCGKTFKYQKNVTSHVMAHRDERPYKCKVDQCTKSFLRSRSLKEHMQFQHCEDPNGVPLRFICKICKKGFRRKSDMMIHGGLHNEGKPFKCTVQGCTSSFKIKKHLRNHERSIHKKNSVETKIYNTREKPSGINK